MDWDVTLVRPLPDHRIPVELADGRRGVFDVEPYLHHGVFRDLKVRAYFERVGIESVRSPGRTRSTSRPKTLLAEMTSIGADAR